MLDSKILHENFGGAGDVAQDRTMVLHDAARRSARAARIDDACGIAAPDPCDPLIYRPARRARIALEHAIPFVIGEAPGLLTVQIIYADDVFSDARRLQGTVERPQQFFGRDDHRLGT